jgi:hypothetical protein
MKKVLIISFSDIDRDPRVAKQVSLLKHCDVTVAGTNFTPDKEKFIPLGKTRTVAIKKPILGFLLFFRFFNAAFNFNKNYIRAITDLSSQDFDIIVANDFNSLPIAAKIKKSAKILFDAHEYSPREAEDSFLWRIFFQKYVVYILKTYLPFVDYFTTVCQGISDEYAKEFGRNAEVFMNTPPFENLDPTQVGKKIKLVCHTAAIPSRKIEKLVEMAEFLEERFELNLVLMPTDLNYVGKIKSLAAGKKNINFLDAVPMKEISKFLNQFDVGVYLIEPSNFNNHLALPNKFFEFIQARLAIAIGPSPEMSRIVNFEKIGVVSDSFDPKDLAKKLNSLGFKEINDLKVVTHSIAKKYSSEVCWKGFSQIIDKS